MTGISAPAFESVTAEEFARILASAKPSAAFKKQYDRYEPSLYDGWNGPDYRVYRGDLIIDGNLVLPGLATLVLGEITVSGFVDLENDSEKGFDEGGLFIALKSVHCRVFSGWYGKCSFVDGDLVAEDMIINAYEDSSLVVTENLRTRFFLGQDIAVEVGGHVDMAYGVGCALPLGGTPGGAVTPRHDEASSFAVLAEDDPEKLSEGSDMIKRVREGRPLFR
jgi:hypothetical protein